MKESKAVYVTKRDLKLNLLQREYQYQYQTYLNRVLDIDVGNDRSGEIPSRDVGVQYSFKKDNRICTCRNLTVLKRHPEGNRYFSSSPKQIYTYHRTRSYTDIGVGSVIALQKKKVKKIYLPETEDRGVGSSDLSSFSRRSRYYRETSYYEHKRTSSKCVGVYIENTSEGVVSAKVSPIIQTKSGTTSPKEHIPINRQNNEIGNNTIVKQFIAITTQIDTEDIIRDKERDSKTIEVLMPKQINKKIYKQSTEEKKEIKEIKTPLVKTANQSTKKLKIKVDKSFSSDSLVQHVHNLENPSEVKSIDMENKLERDYRKIFATTSKVAKEESNIDKPLPDFKSASFLRRRFDALRRTLGKKEDSKKNCVIINKSSIESYPSHKDASVTSDPPSLEGRSYSNMKTYRYNPYTSIINEHNDEEAVPLYKKSYTGRREHDSSSQFSRSNTIDSQYAQGVKGMFKLWGKKFNLDEEKKDIITPRPSFDVLKKTETPTALETTPTKPATNEKKEEKKFFFFKKKNKDAKPKKTFDNNKKGVTAGRCEVRDGLMVKIGGGTTPNSSIAPGKVKTEKTPTRNQTPEGKIDSNEIIRNAWLMKYLTMPIESKASVNVRWNNKTYATSSSTIFELLENVYKETGVVFRSKSEIITDESSYYKSYTKQNLNFLQNVQAWMIPKTILDQPIVIERNCADNKTDKSTDDDVQLSTFNQKSKINKSKAFVQKIEVVLHSNNIVKLRKSACASECLKINIPRGFFSDSSSEEPQVNQTSDEEVYKIVEYETLKSSSDVKNVKKHYMDLSETSTNMKVTINIGEDRNFELNNLNRVLKGSTMHRDVVIQDSIDFIPKKYDCVGVGIITQRDTKEVRKPIFKLLEYVTDEESDRSIQIPQKKCEFTESYLQDYYRNTPMGIDLYSWYVSDSHLKCFSDNPSLSSLHNGDGSKSCPNVYDNYLASAIVSSCATSSCSQCCPVEDKNLAQQNKKNKNNKKSRSELEDPLSRVLPKDSLEVFKRRKIYAASNKSTWNYTEDELLSAPCFDGDSRDCSKPKPCFKTVGAKSTNEKQCKKQVSLQEYEILKPKTSISGILAFKGSAGCDICKKKDMVCPKHAKVSEKSMCSIPDSTCREFCLENNKPQCAQANSNPCSPPSSPPRLPKTCCVNKKLRTCPPEPCPPVPCPSPPPYCKSSPCSTSPKCSPKSSFPPPPLCPPKPSCSPPLPCPLMPTCRPKLTCSQRCPAIPSPPKSICSPLPPCKPKFTCPPQLCPPKPCHSQPCPPEPCSPKPCTWQPFPPQPCPSKPCQPQPCPSQPPKPKLSLPQPCPPKQYQPQPSPPQPCPPPLCSPKTCPARPCPLKPQLSSKSCSPVSSGIKLTRLPCPHSPKCPSPPKKTKPKQPVYCDMSPCREQKPCPRMPCADVCTTPRRPVTSPCDGCKPSKKLSSDEFPWPTKNQISPSSSRLSVCCPKSNSGTNCSSPPQKKKDNCAKNCVLKPSPPPCPLAPPLYPDAPPPTMVSKPCPASPPRKHCPHKPAKSAKSRISGLFLRQKPKKCSNDCLAWEKEQGQRNILRLNSHERITISMKEKTPSTEEIREMMGIKVQDEDGQTLYERADYGGGQDNNIIRNWCKKSACKHESSYLCNICKGSNVNVHKVGSARSRVSKSKSDPSKANLVEINFKLTVTQGDKTTEINVENDGDSVKRKNEKEKNKRRTSQEVFVLKNDEVEPSLEETNPRNDINIRILIKNYKSTSDKKKHTEYKKNEMDNEFSKQISEKFQTVSTGYSSNFNELQQDDSHIFSVHRATIDLSSSFDKSQSQFKKSEEKITEQQLHENYQNKKESTTKKSLIEMPLTERYVVEQPVVDKPITEQLLVVKPEENLISIEKYVVKKSIAELIAVDKLEIGQAESKKDTDIEVTRYASSKGEAKNYTKKSEISTKPVKKWYDKQSDTHFSLTTDTDDQEYSLGLHVRTSESERHTDLGNKTSDDPDTDILVKTSDEPIIDAEKTYKDNPTLELVHRSRFNEKKAMLKELFENANYLTKPKTKSRINKLKNMIKAILTSDSSEPGDSLVVVTSNALAKDITYASLKPTIFKNSNSLNNFYIGESAFGLEKYSSDERPQFPTEENSPKESDEWSDTESKVTNRGCLCSKLAAGLEKCNKNVSGGCCCKKVYKYDQETICDLRNNEDELLSCRSAEYVDVETQNILFFDKTYSTNVSVNDKLHSATGENPPDKLTQLHSKTKSPAEISNFEENEHNIKTKISKVTHIPQQNTAQVNSKIKPPEIFVDDLIQSVFKRQTADKSSSRKLAQLKSNKEPKVVKKDNEKQLDQVHIVNSPGKLLHMPSKIKSLSIEIFLENLIERVCSKSQLTNKEIPPEILTPLNLISETNQNNEQDLETKEKTSIKKSFSPRANHINECELKKLNRNTKLGISEDDKIVFLESESTKTMSIGKDKKYKEKIYEIYKHRHKHAKFKHSDILQMYETKKAVLEIYAEKKEADDGGGHLVAKLPKFIYDIETELFRNYKELTSNSFKTMCKRNFLKMSVKR